MIRKEIHTRSTFASLSFKRYIELLSRTIERGSMSGTNTQLYLRKINQSNKIWKYYSKEFGKAIKETI